MARRGQISFKSPLQRRIMALLEQGVSARSAAEQVGVSAHYVREIAGAAGYQLREKFLAKQAARRDCARKLLKKGLPAAEVALRAGIHRSRVYALRAKMQAETVDVPGWVPEEYRKDYVLIVEQDDEFAAAAYVRRQKQQQAA